MPLSESQLRVGGRAEAATEVEWLHLLLARAGSCHHPNWKILRSRETLPLVLGPTGDQWAAMAASGTSAPWVLMAAE